jgi:hypothetical protein
MARQRPQRGRKNEIAAAFSSPVVTGEVLAFASGGGCGITPKIQPKPECG